MDMRSIRNNKIPIAIAAFGLTLLFILREYFSGGVVTHHFLANDDLPGISNWFGIVTVPLLTWICLGLIMNRQDKNLDTRSVIKKQYAQIINLFLGGLIFGMIVSVLWELDMESILQYVILLPLLISLFRPVHFPECLLGFVMGMLYTFGGILPIIIGTVLLMLSLVVDKVIRGGVMILWSNFR